MAMEFDVLTRGLFEIKTLGDNKQREDFILLTLRYQHFPGGEHRSHPPLFLSADAARNLAMALLQKADELAPQTPQHKSPN